MDITTKYERKIIDRAIALYNEEIDGKRIYRVEVITSIIKREFPGRCEKLSRATIYLWLNRYDRIHYRNRREQKDARGNIQG